MTQSRQVLPLMTGTLHEYSSEVLSCNTRFFENLLFLVTKILSASKRIYWYLIMSCIDLATRFKIGMHLLNRDTRYERFSNKQILYKFKIICQPIKDILSHLNSAHALGGVSGVASFIPLMNSFNKTEVTNFPCRLCFLRAFPFISLY